MTKEQEKRLEEIRKANEPSPPFYENALWHKEVVFLLTLIDEQAAEVERLKGKLKTNSDLLDKTLEHGAELEAEVERLKDKTWKEEFEIECAAHENTRAEVERLKDTSSWEAEIDRLTESRRKRQKELTAARQENQRLREALKNCSCDYGLIEGGVVCGHDDCVRCAALEGKSD